MGIRPAYIELGRRSGALALEGTVFSHEDLGETGYLLVECAGERLLIEDEDGGSYTIGEKVPFSFREDRICLFDSEDGTRLQ